MKEGSEPRAVAGQRMSLLMSSLKHFTDVGPRDGSESIERLYRTGAKLHARTTGKSKSYMTEAFGNMRNRPS